MQKIIFINRFFFPDHSATSQILTDLVHKLSMEKSEIHIITSRLMYDKPDASLLPYEEIEDIHVHRCWTSKFGRSGLIGRAIDYLTFYITSFFILLKLTSKDDIVIAKTDPPLISVLAGTVVIIKKAKLVNWLQDLFPEVAKELGISLLSGGLYNVIKNIRNWSLKIADKNIVLGDIMAEKVNSEIESPESTVIIPNWVVGKEMQPVKHEDNLLRFEWGLNNKFVIGYSGNLGRAHDYETILEAAIKLSDYNEICFVFIGGGAGYDALKKEVISRGLGNVYFKPYQSSDMLSQSLSVPDVHLISLEPSLEGLIVPSKFYGIISVGRPIVFLGDTDGEIARYISKYNCGCSSVMGDSVLLAKILLEFKENKAECELRSLNSRKLYEDKFYVGNSINLWQNLLDNLHMAQN